MILIDPDLDPDPAPASTSVKRKSASVLLIKSHSVRLPSARTLTRFLGEAQAAVRLKGEVTALLTTDAALRRLNRQFRGKNRPTDVLSFPVESSSSGPEKIAGDLAISVPTALRQAVEQGHSLSMEIKVLILHGLLHLAGHDHEADDGKMARRERLLRGRLGLPEGLIERAQAPAKTILKGDGLKRAAMSQRRRAAGTTKGMESGECTFPRGLKPHTSFVDQMARLKPRPFKASASPVLTKQLKPRRFKAAKEERP